MRDNILVPVSQYILQEEGREDCWICQSPQKKNPPGFAVEQGQLIISATGKAHSVGKWFLKTSKIRAGETYLCTVEGQGKGILSYFQNMVAKIRWESGNSAKKGVHGVLQDSYEEFLISISSGEDSGGWVTLEKEVTAPPQAEILVVELYLISKAGGRVCFRNPRCVPVQPKAPRWVTLATVNGIPPKTFTTDEVISFHLNQIDRAELASIDLVCLPETLNTFEANYNTVGYSPEDSAETVPGPITEQFAGIARKYGTYIIFGLCEKIKGELFNTAILLNRQGEVVGKYHKVSLTFGEESRGISGGTSFPVFSTDFGKIGILICYDGHFPENFRELILKGAEVIFLPMWSVGHWEQMLPTRAYENGCYLVVSACDMKSSIINPEGYIVSSIDRLPGLITRRIDLNKKQFCNWDGSQVKEHFRYGRKPQYYREVCKIPG